LSPISPDRAGYAPDRSTITRVADPHADPAVVASAYQLHREGLSQRAIAEQLGIAQSTVSAHIRRGRAAQAAIALHDVAEKRMDSDGFLVDLREWLEGQKDACESVTEAAALVRELRQIEARRAQLLGLNMPERLAVEMDRPAPGPDPALVAAIRKLAPQSSAEDMARAAKLFETDRALYEAVSDHAFRDPEVHFEEALRH
jgi:hypothetical protein